jgi:hypothetical protein
MQMGYVRNGLLLGCFALLFVIAFFPGAAFAAQDVKVEVKDGPAGPARPDLDTAAVLLTFQGIQNGSAHIQLASPEKDFFSPTDFPWVEGTPLIDAKVAIEDGKASFEYMFPIRGKYPLTVEWFDENEKSIGTNQLVIPIQENSQEIRNAILFVALLGVFGLAAGFGLSKWRGRSYAA